ncbi:hypothetical protein LTS15_004035 [Exophiala xenobiotica]|nr:hypothetical protein LTS15_004035 [Exophiala xenobiotica]
MAMEMVLLSDTDANMDQTHGGEECASTAGFGTDTTPGDSKHWSESFAADITIEMGEYTSLSDVAVAVLRKFASVPVSVGENRLTNGDSIIISSTNLEGLLYAFTHTIWPSLPGPPECERAYVIAWKISAEN